MMDREEIARVEVGQTNVSAGVARALVGWFLLMLVVLPVVELVAQPRTVWDHLARIPDRIEGGLFAANRAVLEGFNAFETALDDQSAVGRALRPQTQRVLSGWLGAGNERVYIGRDGWLFYRPDVEYVTGRGFLDQRQMDRRVAAAREFETVPQPDPRPAIRRFKRDLEARGITLVLLPTPVKPTIHAKQMAGIDDAPQNLSYGAFIDELRGDGVLVFEPSREMQYLVTDTHWRPEAMQRVAEALVVFLDENVRLQPAASPGYTSERREARNTGDTAAMLDLPKDQTLYPQERVTLRFIVDRAGDPWRSSRDADVLLLGDSFTNMYSLPTMGWGEAAGFAEQLSYTLQRPLDRIVQNDDGAYATREILRRESGGPSDRLAGKRVVIWQFAARELAFGDWKVIDIP